MRCGGSQGCGSPRSVCAPIPANAVHALLRIAASGMLLCGGQQVVWCDPAAAMQCIASKQLLNTHALVLGKMVQHDVSHFRMKSLHRFALLVPTDSGTNLCKASGAWWVIWPLKGIHLHMQWPSEHQDGDCHDVCMPLPESVQARSRTPMKPMSVTAEGHTRGRA